MKYVLLPCPFCGGAPEFGEVPAPQENHGGRYIQCTTATCQASSRLVFFLKDDDGKRMLVESWNRRTEDSGLPLERAAQAIRALADSGENKDKWTITRGMAFYEAEQAVRRLMKNPTST